MNDGEASATTETKENKLVIKECELCDEEFEKVKEACENKSSEDEESKSEQGAAFDEEANFEQNDEDNDNSNDENKNDEKSQDDASEGTIKHGDAQEENESEETEDPRQVTRTTQEVKPLDPNWKGQMHHQMKNEQAHVNEHKVQTNNKV